MRAVAKPATHASGRRQEYGWFWLIQVAAVVDTALLLAAGLYLQDKEALALAVVLVLTLAWILWRPGRIVPVVVRALVFADVAIWMAPAAVSNVLNHESVASSLVPAVLGITAIVGLVGVAGFLVARGRTAAGRGLARGVAVAALAAVLLLAGVAVATGSGPGSAGAGDVLISATNAKFSTTTLTTNHGTVTVDFTNNDLFWHTFTISALDVDVRAPVKGHRQIRFNAAPGTYQFFCAIPGHKQIGMVGTLVVR